MAEISAATVAQLREMTNAGMMTCKKALMEANGNLEAAVDILRKKGMATAERKAARDAKEGIVTQCIQAGARVGVLAEVNCETDFVAKNDDFRAFADSIAKLLAADPKADFEAARSALVAKVGENIKISRSVRYEINDNGAVAAYIHTGSKVGVLVEVGASKEGTVQKDEFKQAVRDITLQIAAASPVAVSHEGIDPAVLEKEKEIAREQVKNKPAQVVEKIVAGKLEKFYQTVCLLDQGFVKQNGEISVREYIANVSKQLEDTLVIRRFVRFKVGEASAV